MGLNKLLGGGLRSKRSGRELRNRTPNILTPYVSPIYLDCGGKNNRKGDYYYEKTALQECAIPGEYLITPCSTND